MKGEINLNRYNHTYYEKKKTEATEQRRIIAYCESMSAYNSDYKMIYHIPNEGKRKERTGANLKRIGMKKGVPDLCVAVPKLNLHGLYIELKLNNKKKVTNEQIQWIEDLTKRGYAATVCFNGDEAITLITAYINGDSEAFYSNYRHAVKYKNTVKFQKYNEKTGKFED